MRPTQVIRRVATFLFPGLIPLVTICQAQVPQKGLAQRSLQPNSIACKLGAETVAEGLKHPWALAFLPEGRILVTERPAGSGSWRRPAGGRSR
jgi:glucose/arabinose dehydrogenase